MASPLIPETLVELVKERRVIPFIGAGFSACLGLPTWEELLKRTSEELPSDIPFEDLKRLCGGDLLQIAEYLCIKSDNRIGPLRHSISRFMRPEKSPARISPSHVELANLNAIQCYTTNYDDAIELVYRDLGLQHQVISLPKDIALADPRKTQIIKFHGDLRHEQTLVLTESSYYRRLDFESPMDLKFRSDLLGKSVLFIGYSFRDINIRIIWHKLMHMMRDISKQDRPPSFIVRFDKNPVLDTLYSDVGLTPIVLDPNGRANSSEEKQHLLDQFLFDLAVQSSTDGRMPGTNRPMFLTSTCLGRYAQEVVTHKAFFGRRATGISTHFKMRDIPAGFANEVAKSIEKFSPATMGVPTMALKIIDQLGANTISSSIISRALFSASGRKEIFEWPTLNWSKIWRAKLDADALRVVLDNAKRHIFHHAEFGDRDHSFAYAVDVLSRCEQGQLGCSEAPMKKDIKSTLQAAFKTYPVVSKHKPLPDDQAPNVSPIIAAIDAAAAADEAAHNAEYSDEE